MKVELKTKYDPYAEQSIVEIARVSSSRKDKGEDPERLIRYLIRNKHWSPFEHSHVTLSIVTSKAIAIQLLRHRSFSFQEFSQRYQEVGRQQQWHEPVQLRAQAKDNRQSSTTVIETDTLDQRVAFALDTAITVYRDLIASGVSRETARFILPMATTTTLHMTGSLRSWIHFLGVRDDKHAQLEMQDIAKKVRAELTIAYPLTMNAILDYDL